MTAYTITEAALKFWLLVGVASIGGSWLLCCLATRIADSIDTWRARRDLGAHFDQAVSLGNAEGEQ